MSEKNLSNAQRAKLQKERKKMVREAKNYQKERKQAEKVKKPVKVDGPFSEYNAQKAAKAPVNKQKPVQNKPVTERKNNYGDGFYIDETKGRKEAFEKKKKAKKQKPPLTPKQRRRRHILTYSLIFTVVLIIGIILSLTILFKTEKINVEGNTLYEEDKIVLLSGVKMEQNIFIAKFGSTPEKISDSLPYIEEAWVDFKIPDTITIKVKNATPSYAVVSQNKFYIVSDKGKILSSTQQMPEDLPLIVGVELTDDQIGKHIKFKDEKIGATLTEIRQCCVDNGYKNITYVNVSDPSKISIVYDGRIEIIIGLPDDVSYKLKTAMTIITQKLDIEGTAGAMGTLDVSECNTTKKSYFKDGAITTDVYLPTTATQPTTQPTEPTTVPEEEATEATEEYTWTSSDDGGYDGSDYSSDDSSYDDGSYDDGSYDDGSYDDGSSDDSSYDDGSYDDSYDDSSYEEDSYDDSSDENTY